MSRRRSRRRGGGGRPAATGWRAKNRPCRLLRDSAPRPCARAGGVQRGPPVERLCPPPPPPPPPVCSLPHGLVVRRGGPPPPRPLFLPADAGQTTTTVATAVAVGGVPRLEERAPAGLSFPPPRRP